MYAIDEVDNTLQGHTTTDASGNYIFEGLESGKTYHIATSYVDTGSNEYNAESKPFVVPVSN